MLRPGVRVCLRWLTVSGSTGVTGYIAGDATHVLYQAHPDYDYTFLIRSEDKAAIVRKAYPAAQVVLGGLDDSKLLEQEAAKADIVLRLYFHLDAIAIDHHD